MIYPVDSVIHFSNNRDLEEKDMLVFIGAQKLLISESESELLGNKQLAKSPLQPANLPGGRPLNEPLPNNLYGYACSREKSNQGFW